MADTETGWTDEFPTVMGFYFVRTEQYRELPAEFDGRVISGLHGARFFPDDIAHHHPEFLGPFSASDVQQLTRLRQAAEKAMNWIQAQTWPCQHGDQPMRCSRCATRQKATDLVDALRAALEAKQ